MIESVRDLARWLYRQLEAEHDFQCDAKQIDEALREAGFAFTGHGQRFG